MISIRPSHLLGTALASLCLAASTSAQACPSGVDTFWKNDSLPDVPVGQLTLSVIPGLCEGEAAATVFELAPTSPAQLLSQVSVGFGSGGGAQGATALVNIEIYDGVTFSGGSASLGTKVFDFEQLTGASLQLTSTGINAVDLTQFNVVVGNDPSNKYVVAARMAFNPSGSCAAGYTSNFVTDNGGVFGGCTATPQVNLIDELTGSWTDASTLTIGGFPACPLAYNVNWVIRACTRDDPGSSNPLNVTISGSPVAPGGFVNATFNALGFEGETYIAAASLGMTPGTPTAFGVVPLNIDFLFNISVASTSGIFVNFVGNIGPAGTAPGLILVPNDPIVVGISFYTAFIVIPAGGAPWGISDAAQVQIQ